MITETVFGVLDGREIPLLTLRDGPVSVELIPLGAAVRAICVPDREGRTVDVCLGYDTPAEYREWNSALGGTLGRCANRIGGARFTIGGAEYRLTANEGANTLHGGAEGFHKKLWDYAVGADGVVFSLDSPDGDEGFPGNLHAEVAYTLRDGVLTMAYRAACDRDTVVNLSNHTYFNLAGHDAGTIAGHRVTLGAGRYTPSGAGNVPTGEIAPVDGTPLDLRQGALLEERLGDPFLEGTRGYDHNFVLDGGEIPAAEVHCPATGIALEVRTTLEGMQFYTSGFLTDRPGKGGALYGRAGGLCLETQRFPDAVNHPAFPSPVLRAGEEYRQTTSWRFFVK